MKRTLRSKRVISLGYRIDRYDSRDYRYSAAPRALPAVVDNRAQVARIMNQNPEGACPGHAVCTVAEFQYWRRSGKKVDLSQRWAYRKARENDPWPGENYHGSTLRAAIAAWATYGMCKEEYWPYEAYQIAEESPEFDLVAWEGEPREGAAANALQHPVQTYRRCDTPFAIKHAIHEHGIVAVGGPVHSGWDIWGEGTIPYDDGVYELGGHAFALVGYNEEARVYYVANSWGEEWGKNGFAEYSYNDANENIRDAWVATVPSGTHHALTHERGADGST